jgi:thiosulfate dehydrogenase [quinone] large subunit
LGLLLILGVLTLPAAMVSLLTLMTYWSSNQLIVQYPIKGALSVVVIAWPLLAARFSATSLFVSILQRRQQAGVLTGGPVRRWL